MSIEIRKVSAEVRDSSYRRYDVLVNDEVWGGFDIEFGSRYGTRYYLFDSFKKRVDGDAVRSSSRHHIGSDPKTLVDRLAENVSRAIEAGLLLSPAVLRERREEQSKRLEEIRLQREKERDQAFEKKAREMLLDDGFSEPFPSRMVPLLIAAMKWGQEQ